MKLSIVVPTIPGREEELLKTQTMYEERTPVEIEWIVERGHSTCGAGWNAGAKKATGEILHMGADDVHPNTKAWWLAAVAVLERGRVPLGWVYENGARFGRDFCRVVICMRDWWQDVPETHYYSDDAFTWLMVQAGHTPTIIGGFDFIHRKSMVGRDETPERYARDRRAALDALGLTSVA